MFVSSIFVTSMRVRMTSTVVILITACRAVAMTARRCPATMRYSECVSACPRTCSGVYGAVAVASTEVCGADDQCHPGCECSTGTFLAAVGAGQAPVCVDLADCPCSLRGENYPPGTVIDIGCNAW